MIFHYQIHKDDEQPYICDVCGTGFIRIHILNEHSQYYSQEKPSKSTSRTTTAVENTGEVNEKYQKFVREAFCVKFL